MRKRGILIESSIKRASAIPEFRSGKPFFYAKKQFHFPAMTVEVGHRLGRDDNIVGEKVIGLVVFRVVILGGATVAGSRFWSSLRSARLSGRI